jgi:hypothetical protein
LGLGIVVSFFLPLFFAKSNLDWPILFGSYYTFLAITLVSYFNNYRQILLIADQRSYTLTRVGNYLMILKVILQIVCLKYIDLTLSERYFVWLGFELLFAYLLRTYANWVVKRDYPSLQFNLKNGRQLLKAYPQILQNVKKLFAHKIGEFALFQTSQILIYIYTTLTIVTYYGNYLLITKQIANLVGFTLGSNLAGVGHVVAEGNNQKSYNLFTEFNALFFFIGGVIIYCLYYLTEPFMVLWLGGEEFILSKIVFLLILASAYILIIRQPISFFLNGFGLYSDVWAPWTEASINLLVAIIAGYYWGLAGILFGSLISSIFVIIWKPYFLFRNGFKISVLKYWKNVLIYVVLLVLSYIVLLPLHKYLPEMTSFFSWALNGAIIASIFAVIYGGSMYLFAPGLKGVVMRLLGKWMKK